MKDKIVKVMHALAIVIGLLSFFLMLGTAGAIENDSIELAAGFKRLFAFIAIMGVSVLIGNATKEEDYDEAI